MGEGFAARLEANLGARAFRRTRLGQGRLGNPMPIKLFVEYATLAHLQLQFFGQCINHRNADTMQASRHFVSIVVKLAAGM